MRMLSWFCGCLLAWSVSGKELYINFDDYPEGSSPTNFHSALAGEGSPGRWRIVNTEVPSFLPPLTDKATVDRHGVLAQTAEDMTDERFPMFIYDGQTFSDFKLSTRFKVVSGIAEQMAGMVFRFQDSSNFYVVRVSSLGRNVRFYKVVNGVRSDPIGPTMDVAAPGTRSGSNATGTRSISASMTGPSCPRSSTTPFRRASWDSGRSRMR